MKSVAGVLAIILSFIPFEISAQETGFYAGASLGYSDFPNNESQLIFTGSGNTTVNSLDTDLDDTDIGWKFYGGYGFNKYLGLEAGYVDLGESTSTVDTNVTLTPLVFSSPITIPGIILPPPPSPTPIQISASSSTTIEVNGFTFSAVASYPLLEKLDVFAKGGAFFWHIDLESTASITSPIGTNTVTFGDNDDGIDFTFSLGARFNFNDNISIRAEWDRYMSVPVNDNDIDLFSAGIEWHF